MCVLPDFFRLASRYLIDAQTYLAVVLNELEQEAAVAHDRDPFLGPRLHPRDELGDTHSFDNKMIKITQMTSSMDKRYNYYKIKEV